jgi:hypothetical protein
MTQSGCGLQAKPKRGLGCATPWANALEQAKLVCHLDAVREEWIKCGDGGDGQIDAGWNDELVVRGVVAGDLSFDSVEKGVDLPAQADIQREIELETVVVLSIRGLEIAASP